MPQLQKAKHLATRFQIPCAVAGCNREHRTIDHGKDEGQRWQEHRSRQMNPRDRLHVPETVPMHKRFKNAIRNAFAETGEVMTAGDPT